MKHLYVSLFCSVLFPYHYCLRAAAVVQAQPVPQLAQGPQVLIQPPAQDVQQQVGVGSVTGVQDLTYQEQMVELPSDQQYLLPTLVKRKVLPVEAQNCGALSVSQENSIAVLKGGQLHVLTSFGQKRSVSCLDRRQVASCAFVGNDVMLSLVDGSRYTLNIEANNLKLVPCSDCQGGTIVCCGARGVYALSDQDSKLVSIKFSDKPEQVFNFAYPIDLLATTLGSESFVLANRDNPAITIISKGRDTEHVPLEQLPTALAIHKDGRVAVGSPCGKIFLFDAQRQSVSFESGSSSEVVFIALFSDVIMVAHAQEDVLRVFSLANRQLLYSLRLSDKPIQHIAVNNQGTIVAVDQEGKMRVLSVDPRAQRSVTALNQQQKNVLLKLITAAQQRDLSDEILAQGRAEVALIPKIFIDNLRRMSPMRIVRQPVLAQESREQQVPGPVDRLVQAREEQSAWDHFQLSCKKGFRSVKRFTHDHAQLSVTVVIMVAYVLLHKVALRKSSKSLTERFGALFGKSTGKSRFLLF